MAVALRSPEELERLSACGRVLWGALERARALVAPGVTPLEIESAVRESVRRAGARAVLVGLGGRPGRPGFPASACVSVNDVAAHGVPDSRPLASGDLVSIDTAVELDGWVCDGAVSVAAGPAERACETLLRASAGALDAALGLMKPGVAWRSVAEAIGRVAERAGLSVADAWVGHGVGRWVHESPRLAVPPPWGTPERWARSDRDLVLRPGMVLAVEPTLCERGGALREEPGGWAWRTADGGRSAHEERTVAVTRSGPVVLTRAGWVP